MEPTPSYKPSKSADRDLNKKKQTKKHQRHKVSNDPLSLDATRIRVTMRCDVLCGGRKAESNERSRETFSVHLHASATHVLILPLGRRRRLYTARGHTTCTTCGESVPASNTHTHTHTHTFNGPFYGTTRVSRYQNPDRQPRQHPTTQFFTGKPVSKSPSDQKIE